MGYKFDLQCWILRLLSIRKSKKDNPHLSFEEGFKSSVEYFFRFGKIDFTDKTILDIGCGLGSTCFYLASKGAIRVVGTDTSEERINFAKSMLNQYSQQNHKISFFLLKDLPKKKFDIVLLKDSFEHYNNPENFIDQMLDYLKPNGLMIIGFSNLWNSPFGGHLGSFSRWPWIHLMFAEPVIMHELRRFFKDDKIRSFDQVASGLNKMTYRRFIDITSSKNLNFVFLKTNISSNSRNQIILTILGKLACLSFVREYFTVNVYCILNRDKSLV